VKISPFSLLAIGLSALTLITAAPLRAEPPAGWKLVFDDEFNGDSLDESKWSTTMKFIGTHGERYHNEYYLSYTCDEEVVVREGTLRLRTDRRTVEGAEAPGIFNFTQGLISSHDKFSFTHGYVEIRAKYPGGKGLWPCLWLMPQNQGWPPEFDIAEYYAGQKTMHHGLAYGELYDSRWDSLWDKKTDFESGFHTFGLEWTAGRAVWSVDGEVRKTILADYVPNVPMYLVLSNSISSVFGPSGEPDERTVFPNEFQIDYVRVYQAPPAEVPAIVAAPAAPLLPVGAILPTP
jgi:beta-glucanase (GH16 family)